MQEKTDNFDKITLSEIIKCLLGTTCKTKIIKSDSSTLKSK